MNILRRIFGQHQQGQPHVHHHPQVQGGDAEIEQLVRHHHERRHHRAHHHHAARGQMEVHRHHGQGAEREEREFYKGGKVTGDKEDYDAEIDTVPARLQAGEVVLPRVYSKLGTDMLKREHLPLPIPGKVEKVMHEFKHHKLHDSHGKIVKDKKQAVAIALNVARHSKK